MQGIYKITNKINNKIYIGKANNSDRRWRDHQRLAFTEGHKEYEKVLYKAFRKYGIENFSFEIIEELEDYSISGEREIYWIQYYDSYNNGYNENLGGDGGSNKGHCAGEANGRAKLTKEDVINIRTKFSEGCSKNDCYSLYSDKITKGGFAKVWLGKTWQNIMPEVYTEENIRRNESLGKAKASLKKRLFSNEEVIEIRKRKNNNESISEVYKDYQERASFDTFKDLWYNKTYQEVII